mgnify:CR=1 FL=1
MEGVHSLFDFYYFHHYCQKFFRLFIQSLFYGTYFNKVHKSYYFGEKSYLVELF